MLWGFFLGTLLTLTSVCAAILIQGETASLLAGVQALGSLAVAFSALIAYRLYKANIGRHIREDKRAESKAYLEESIALLERAYETFTRLGANPPKNDRLLWLSTARMLIRFKRMRAKIEEQDHIVVIDEHEEYYRLKFYTLLDSNQEHLTLEYFMPEGNPYDGNNVHRRSIAIIFDFMKWRDDIPDPLEGIDDQELFARGAVPITFLGVENYLGQFQEYWEEIQERKERYEEN